MKKALIVALAALLTLTGCGTAATTAPAASTDEAYLSAARTESGTLAGVSDATLVKSGKGVCGQLRADRTASDLFDKAVTAGLTTAEATAIIESAIATYCPEQEWHSAV